MEAEVRVFATLRRYLPELAIGEAKIVQIEPGTTLDQLRECLDLPAEEVKVIMVNNLQADPDDLVSDGDRVTYIPAVAGG
ncbi:MAG: MoaD/ThiS family protein [Anaerolineales bacterium]|nr:MoaD/ThiS family protein [Anaerolineales bacterium]